MTEPRPAISVIIPLYKGTSDTLKRAVDSAVAQSIDDLEIVILAYDQYRSGLKIALAASNADPRIRVVPQATSTDTTDRKYWGTVANGFYVSFLDAEGRYPDNNVLEDLLRTIRESGLRIAGGNYEVADTRPVDARINILDDGRATDARHSFLIDATHKYSECQIDSGLHRFLIARELLAGKAFTPATSQHFHETLFVVQILDSAREFAALKRTTHTYGASTDRMLSEDSTLDELEAMSEILEIADRRGYHELQARILRRFRTAGMQHAIRVSLSRDRGHTGQLIKNVARLTADRLDHASGNFHAMHDKTRIEPPPAYSKYLRREPTSLDVDVSVIVPVYNAAEWLHECLLSVLGQSGISTEIICVNDGSSDDSMRILQWYRALHPQRIRVIDQTNSGLSVARNTGLNAAIGRYVCMLDSDDYWRLDGLHSLVSRADSQDIDVLQFDAVPFREAELDDTVWARYATYYHRPDQPTGVLSGAELLAKQRLSSDYKPNAGLYMVRRTYLAELGLRFIPRIMHEDNPFTFSVMLNAKRAAHEALNLHARRVRSDSIMNSGSIERSMRGYFVSYLRMREEAARHTFDIEIAKVIGSMLYGIFNNVSARLEQVDDDAAERLTDLITSADAQQTYSILMRLRNQVGKRAASH